MKVLVEWELPVAQGQQLKPEEQCFTTTRYTKYRFIFHLILSIPSAVQEYRQAAREQVGHDYGGRSDILLGYCIMVVPEALTFKAVVRFHLSHPSLSPSSVVFRTPSSDLGGQGE